MPTNSGQISGITGADPSGQSVAVNTAVAGITDSTVQDSLITTKDKKEAISSINQINSVVSTYVPKISNTIDKLAMSFDNFVGTDMSAISTSINNLTAVLDNLGSGLPNETVIRIELPNIDKAGIASLSSLINYLSKEKTAKKIDKVAHTIYNSIELIAKAGQHKQEIDNVVKLFSSIESFAKSMTSVGKGLMMIAAGIAVLGLAIFGLTMLFAENPMLLVGFAVALAVVGGALFLFQKFAEPKKLLLGAAAIATLGLAIWAVTEVMGENDFWLVLKFAAAIAIVGGAMFLFNKLVDPVKTLVSSAAIAIAGLGIYAVGVGIEKFENIDIETVGVALLAVAGIATVMGVAGNFAPNILLGSAAMLVAAGATYLLAKAIGIIADIDTTFEQLAVFGTAAVGIIAAMALAGNPVTLPFVLLGAGSMIAVSGATLLLVAAIAAVGAITIPDSTTFDNFKYGATALRDVFVSVGNPLYLPFMLAGLAQSVMIAGGTLALSAAIGVLSMVPILDQSQYDAFSYAANSIADIFYNIGGPIKLLQITAAAGIMTLVSGATVAMALGITLFSNIISDPATVSSAVESMSMFISGTVDIFSKISSEDFAKVALGIGSFAGLSNMVGEIAKSVAAIGSLSFEEKELRNGKLVTTGVRQFTEADFARVGDSIGLIIRSLTEPLSAIGDDTEGLIFKSNKTQKGIEALSSIGSVLTPITNMVSEFSSKGIDAAFISTYNKNLSALITGIASTFSNIDIKYDDDTLELLDESVSIVNKMFKTMSDESFQKATTNLTAIPANMVKIKDSMNAMDLSKLTAMNDFLVNIQKLEDSDVMKQLAEAFEKLAEALQPKATSSSSSSTVSNVITNTVSPKEVEQKKNTEFVEIIQSSNQSVTDAIREITEKLNSVIKVKVQNAAL